jgi:hypothetical protein
MAITEAQKRWRERNKATVAAANKRWREAHPERAKDSFEIWYYLKGGRNKRLAAIKQKRDAKGNADSGRVQAGIRRTARDVCVGERHNEGEAA